MLFKYHCLCTLEKMSTKPSHFFSYPYLSTTPSTNPSLSNIPKQPSPALPAYGDVLKSRCVCLLHVTPAQGISPPQKTIVLSEFSLFGHLFAISYRYLSFYALIFCPAWVSNVSRNRARCFLACLFVISHCQVPAQAFSVHIVHSEWHLLMNRSVINQKSTVTSCLPDSQTLTCIVSDTPHLCPQVSRQSQIPRLLV